MSKVRYSQRCIFCGHENRKRSDHAIYFRCSKCHQVNPGPGMSAAHAQAVATITAPVAKKNGKHAKTAPPVAVTTVIKAASAEKIAPKAAPKVKAPTPTPKAPVPVADKRPGWAKAIWGS